MQDILPSKVIVQLSLSPYSKIRAAVKSSSVAVNYENSININMIISTVLNPQRQCRTGRSCDTQRDPTKPLVLHFNLSTRLRFYFYLRFLFANSWLKSAGIHKKFHITNKINYCQLAVRVFVAIIIERLEPTLRIWNLTDFHWMHNIHC